MKKIIISGLVCFLSFFLSVDQSIALSVDFENSLVGRDGLEWLSPIYSDTLSYNAVSGLLNTEGSDYDGLRFATYEEAFSLLSSYGYTPQFFSSTSESWSDSYFNLYADFGFSTANMTRYGFYDQYVLRGLVEASDLGLAVLGTRSLLNYNDHVWIHTRGAWWMNDYVLVSEYPVVFGSWLVRDVAPVPEPSTYLLLGTGLLGLLGYRKFKGARY